MITNSQQAAGVSQQARPMSWSQWQLERSPLVLESFDFHECVSGQFYGEVLLSANRRFAQSIDASDVIGKIGTIKIDLPSSPDLPTRVRYITGIVTALSSAGDDDARVYYKAELAPWTWLLSQRSNCRIFQGKSALEVILTVFSEASETFPNLVNYADLTRGGFPERDCIVQHNESDLNFVERLLAEEGIRYVFEHDEQGHTLRMLNVPGEHDAIAGLRSLKFDPQAGVFSLADAYTRWKERSAIAPTKGTVGAFHWQRPDRPYFSDRPARHQDPGRDYLEQYHFGTHPTHAGFDVDMYLGEDIQSAGVRRAETMIDALTVQRNHVRGTATTPSLCPGYRFVAEKADGSSDEYLLLEVQHSAAQSTAYRSGGQAELRYECDFLCVPVAQPYRPQTNAIKPRLSSVETAIVQGPDDETGEHEEIHVDEFGRVRVRFHWDREDSDSAWIRVGQGWASGGFGMHFWPRVGDEVIVAFEHGDPDRPLVMGSVYNTINPPPYALPEGKTRSGIKTRSSREGSPSNFNELRFEDKRGHEQVYLHAERNLDTVVESCESRRIGGSRSSTIRGDDNLKVTDGNRIVDIHKGYDDLVVHEGDRSATIVQGSDFLAIPEGLVSVDAKQGLVQALDSYSIVVGGSSITLLPDRIVLQVGGTVLTLDPTTISSSAVKINSRAVGQHSITGALVKIN